MPFSSRPSTAFGIVAAIVLPPLALGAAGAAVTVAQLPGKEIVDDLANRSLAYWFVALAVVSIGSWTWIVRWLLAQLESQRAANLDSNKLLIAYMERDHADLRTVLARTTDVLERVLHRLEQ